MDTAGPEPWTDAVDEVDPRELAMKRFRTRQELLSDVFGPERLSACSRTGWSWDKLIGRGHSDRVPGSVGWLWDGWRDARGKGGALCGHLICARADEQAALEAENAELERRSREGPAGAATTA